jgi:hypothetical protein
MSNNTKLYAFIVAREKRVVTTGSCRASSERLAEGYALFAATRNGEEPEGLTVSVGELRPLVRKDEER